MRDIKIKPLVEIMEPSDLVSYAAACGWALARAHARTGQASMITGYLGASEVIDHTAHQWRAREKISPPPPNC